MFRQSEGNNSTNVLSCLAHILGYDSTITTTLTLTLTNHQALTTSHRTLTTKYQLVITHV